MFRKKKQPTKIAGEQWDIYTYTYGEGLRAIIGFDVPLAQEKQHQGYNWTGRIIVYIPHHKVMVNGLPQRDELESLMAFENNLITALQNDGVDCKFVGRMTYGAMREFVFQIETVDVFRKSARQVLKRASEYKIELQEQEGWQFFDEKVTPTPVFWQQISDRQVIDALIDAGSDPQVPHLLEHTFLGDSAQLARLQQQLGADSFQVLHSDDERLVMGKDSCLILDEVFGLTRKLFSYCNSIDVSYDGWGAQVRKETGQ
ncbi:MAG: DUF695 domain-containing protein [Proteobacteria bacterium]|nr:DUF695 domain-containing protein [Pseudomonadota bacterium]